MQTSLNTFLFCCWSARSGTCCPPNYSNRSFYTVTTHEMKKNTCVFFNFLLKKDRNLGFTSKILWHVNCLISQMKLNVIKTTVGLIWSIIMLYKLNENCFFPKLQFIKTTDIKIRYYKITWSMYTLIAVSNSLIFLSKQQFIRMPKGYIWQLTWLIFSSHIYIFLAPVRNVLFFPPKIPVSWCYS